MIETYKDIPLNYLLEKDPSFFDSDEFKKHEKIFDSLKKDSPLLSVPQTNISNKYSNFIPYLTKFLISKYEDKQVKLYDTVDLEHFVYCVLKGKYELKKRRNLERKEMFRVKSDYKSISNNNILHLNRINIPDKVQSVRSRLKKLNPEYDDIKNIKFSNSNVSRRIFEEVKFIRSSDGLEVYNLNAWKRIAVNKYLKEFYNINSSFNFSNIVTFTYPQVLFNETSYSLRENIVNIQSLICERYFSKIDLNLHKDEVLSTEDIASNIKNSIYLKLQKVNNKDKYRFESIDKRVTFNQFIIDIPSNILDNSKFYFFDKDNLKVINPVSITILPDSKIKVIFTENGINIKISYVVDTSTNNIINNVELREICRRYLDKTLFMYQKVISNNNTTNEIELSIEGVEEGFYILVMNDNQLPVEYTVTNVELNSITLNLPGSVDIDIYIVPTILFHPDDSNLIVNTQNVMSMMKTIDFYGKNYKSWISQKLL